MVVFFGRQRGARSPVLCTLSTPCLGHLTNRRESSHTLFKPSLHVSLLDHLQPLLKSSTASVESLPWHLQSKMDTLRTHLVLLGSSAPIQLTTSPPFSCCSSECSLAPLSLCETNVKQKEKHRLKQHPKPQHSWDSYSQLLPYLGPLTCPQGRCFHLLS